MTNIHRSYADKNPKVAYVIPCSGCYEPNSPNRYDWDELHQMYIGIGCKECGYTGKRRIHKPKQPRGFARR